MSSGSTSTATRSPATRSSAASSGSPRAMRSTRPGQALARPHPVARLLPGESGDQADRGLGARPRRPRRRRRGESRPASCSFRPAFRASSGSSSTSRSRQRNFLGKGQELSAGGQLFELFASRSSSASPSPICSTATSRSAATSSAATTTASTSSATSATRPTSRSPPAASSRLGVPLTEYHQLGTALRAGATTRSRSTRTPSSPIPTAPARCGLRCDPLLAGRYLCDAIGNRLTSSLGYSLVYDSSTTASARRAASGCAAQQDFAGLGGDVHYLRTPRRRDQISGRSSRGFVFSAHAEGGYIHSFEKRRAPGQRSGPADRPLLPRQPQLRGFDIRGVGPRVAAHALYDRRRATSRPTNGDADQRRARRPRLLSSAASSSKSRSARRSAASACARRSSSTSARSGA